MSQKVKQAKKTDLLSYALTDLFNRILCKCLMGIIGCCGSPSLSRTGSGKGRGGLQSPKVLWNATCSVFLTRIYAVCLEWFLSRIAHQGHCYLNLSSGWLKFPRLWCLTSATRRSGKSSPYYRSGVCLPAPETSVLTLIFLYPMPRKTLPSLHFKEWPCHLPWKGT